MEVAAFEQVFAHGFAGAAFEEDVIRHHHGGFAVDLEHVGDVLHEVELFVGGGGPKVFALIDQLFLFFFTALFVDDGNGALFTKGRIGQDHIDTVIPHFFGQSIIGGNRAFISRPIPCRYKFMAHKRTTLSTISLPRKACSLR